jgi:hypothetical protein
MSHLSEEQLIAHYYGEAEDSAAADEHLGCCADCRQAYAALQRDLNLVDAAPVPVLDANYGRQVWKRLQPSLPRSRRWWQLAFPRPWAAAAATAGLVLLAFFVGRYSMYDPNGKAGDVAARVQVRERVLVVAVSDHLERSQIVLAELVNARPSGEVDISTEQKIASDLVEENRLYRQTAASTGDRTVASLLEELEPVLLEIARGPSQLTAAELDRIQRRVESEGMLFKIRVAGSNLRQREKDKTL